MSQDVPLYVWERLPEYVEKLPGGPGGLTPWRRSAGDRMRIPEGWIYRFGATMPEMHYVFVPFGPPVYP